MQALRPTGACPASFNQTFNCGEEPRSYRKERFKVVTYIRSRAVRTGKREERFQIHFGKHLNLNTDSCGLPHALFLVLDQDWRRASRVVRQIGARR